MNEPWYAVKCLFHHPTGKKDGEDYLYEERITLWKSDSFEQAHAMAEEEGKKYAASSNSIFVGTTDAFHLFDEKIKEGTEVYSIMRGSNMEPEVYENTFCMTKRDRASYFTEEDGN